MPQDGAAVDESSEAHGFVEEVVGAGGPTEVVGGRELGELRVDARRGEHDLRVPGGGGGAEDAGAELGG